MFYGCTALSDIKTLQSWDVSNANEFSDMFQKCPSISNIKPFQNWKDINNMFDNDKYH